MAKKKPAKPVTRTAFEERLKEAFAENDINTNYNYDTGEFTVKPLNKKQKTGAAKVLQKAVALFDKYKWVQGEEEAFDEESGEIVGFCAIGAIKHIDGPYEDYARIAVEASLPKGYGSIENYNDSNNRKKSEVLNVFKRAIKYLSQ